MSEFTFYLGPDERRRLLNGILARDGYFLVPNAPFPEPDCPKISGVFPDVPIEKIIPNMSAFVFGPFSNSGPFVSRLPSGRLHTVSHNQGGPLFKLRIPRCDPHPDGKLGLSSGMLGLEPAFWDADLRQSEPPTPETREHHKDLIRFIKRDVTKLTKREGHWIGTEAWELIQSGTARIYPLAVDELLRTAGTVEKGRTSTLGNTIPCGRSQRLQ